MGSVRCLMSGCNTGLMKRFGRRPLCMLSGCGMAICLSVSGYFTWRILKEGDKELNWVPVLCIMLYVVTSMLGLLSIPWTMTAELFPTEIRGLAHSIAISVANLLMFVSIQTYLNTVEVLGGPAQACRGLHLGSGAATYMFSGKPYCGGSLHSLRLQVLTMTQLFVPNITPLTDPIETSDVRRGFPYPSARGQYRDGVGRKAGLPDIKSTVALTVPALA
uniref:Uncharacterized protein n=1 Tax=Timema poppense TaxID=170557 RepID=A0A7R9CU49_TIMPO|nr:unnamed protein product [Timema poppensis]